MSDSPAPAAAPVDRQDYLSAMFASMVMQQTNMATIFLGLAPNPQTGKAEPDLEHAQFFIDQLEMLETKTKGNLSRQEEMILKQSLTTLRMAFVEVVNKSETAPIEPAKIEPSPGASQPEPAAPTAPAETAPKPAEDSKVKFTKKY